jgi:hypothetical protein
MFIINVCHQYTATVQESVKCTFTIGAWTDTYRINPWIPIQLRIDFRKDVAGRGVTDYNNGSKKLINVFCGERPNVMCCTSTSDDGRKTVTSSKLCKVE